MVHFWNLCTARQKMAELHDTISKVKGDVTTLSMALGRIYPLIHLT